MRRLDEKFLHDLKEDGLLAPITNSVRADTSLCLELRGTYVTVYYRGGSLMKVTQAGRAYSVKSDYLKREQASNLPERIQTEEHVTAWVDESPILKQAIDRHLSLQPKDASSGKQRKDEREFEQLIVRDNNFGGVARSTDYYICDIEYDIGSKSGNKQFDMIAVQWPSESAERKRAQNRRLVIVEVKHGDDALEDPSGLHSHIVDVNNFLSNPDNVQHLKDDMVDVFNQKLALCLINCGKELVGFSDKKPLLVLALANHDPGVSRLRDLLNDLPESPHAKLRIATSSFLGYGLYDQGIRKIKDIQERFGDYIYYKQRVD